MDNEQQGATSIDNATIGLDSRPTLRAARSGPDLVRGLVQKLRADYDGFRAAAVKSIDTVAGRVQLMGEQSMRIFTILGDIETRLETMKAILVRKDVCSEDEFETTWDEVKGLRVKAVGEPIEDGDFVRVTFTATDAAGAVVGQEVNFPVHLGAGHLVIESALVGKEVGTAAFDVVETYPAIFPFNPNLAGKTVTFAVEVGKVKSRIQEGKPGEH